MSLSDEAPDDVKKTDKHKVEFLLDSFSYSEVMPVIETFGGVIPVARIGKETSRSSQPSAGRQAITHNRAFQRYQYQEFIFQLTARYDYNIQFTPDAAQLFFIDRNDRELDKTEYDLFFRAKHIRANGLGIGYQFNYDKLVIKTMLNYWDVQHMEDGYVDGQFLVQDDDSFEVTGEINYKYFKDALLDRQNCPSTDPPVAGCHGAWETDGSGYNLDVEFSYQFNQDWLVSGIVYDLYNEFNFERVGATLGSLDTRNEVINPDGSFSVRPSFSGSYPDGKHKQKVDKQIKVRLDGNLGLPIWSEVYATNGRHFPSLGIGYRALNTQFELGYMFEAAATVVNVKHQNFTLSLVTDTPDLPAARTLVINLGFNYTW
ncbi:hypothetical protein XM47_08185 [Catenovulum maritimum]|uniref:Uncharacterized protein n=2 Tax=Catenovulum maritimum TaxID=1513271 RepID=A0A0J8GSE3_9ALTE|nr:hypothetical protein XM47_08185 [Catenovulum maritimum]